MNLVMLGSWAQQASTSLGVFLFFEGKCRNYYLEWRRSKRREGGREGGRKEGRKEQNLVSAQMQVLVEEDLAHFSQNSGDDVVSLRERGVERDVVDVRGIARAVCGDGVSEAPGGGVTRHVELRDDPDAAVVGVLDDSSELLLGVDGLRGPGSLLGEQRVRRDLWREGLGVDHVPVERVELCPGNGVDDGEDRLDGQVMPGGIDQEASPGEPRGVRDGDWGVRDLEVGGRVARGVRRRN